jgi:5'-methylthioadenosine phosphorylase
MDVKIGIIGGTGIADPDFFKPLRAVDVKTKYGKPSGKVSILDVAGVKVAFIPRHGPKHTIPPHMVNYRANIAALKSLGVERIIGLAAVGSLRENIKAGHLVIPDQFIDMTKQRKLTFYDGPKAVHISVADPFCPQLSKIAAAAAGRLSLHCHDRGAYICVEGPRFSTRAESNLWRMMKADIVGMTLVPECQLAREMEMCYVSIASVTDYDVWADTPVSAKDVAETMRKNTVSVQRMLREIIPRIPHEKVCACGETLKDAGL